MTLTAKDFSLGTLVFITNEDEPLYGVVIDREFWLMEKAKEDQNDVEGCEIPVMLFGKTINIRFPKEGGVSEEYVQKYTSSAAISHISIILGGTKELLNIIWQVKLFFGKAARYYNEIEWEVRVLEEYFKGGYVKSRWAYSDRVRRIQLYEKALPREKLPKKEFSLMAYELFWKFLRHLKQSGVRADEIASDTTPEGEWLKECARLFDKSASEKDLLTQKWWAKFGINFDPNAVISRVIRNLGF